MKSCNYEMQIATAEESVTVFSPIFRAERRLKIDGGIASRALLREVFGLSISYAFLFRIAVPPLELRDPDATIAIWLQGRFVERALALNAAAWFGKEHRSWHSVRAGDEVSIEVAGYGAEVIVEALWSDR